MHVTTSNLTRLDHLPTKKLWAQGAHKTNQKVGASQGGYFIGPLSIASYTAPTYLIVFNYDAHAKFLAGFLYLTIRRSRLPSACCPIRMRQNRSARPIGLAEHYLPNPSRKKRQKSFVPCLDPPSAQSRSPVCISPHLQLHTYIRINSHMPPPTPHVTAQQQRQISSFANLVVVVEEDVVSSISDGNTWPMTRPGHPARRLARSKLQNSALI